MTYNVHGGFGSDMRFDLGRVLRVISEAKPDVVALQELDVGRDRSRGFDQPSWLAERLNMNCEFVRARDCRPGGCFGNAVLSHFTLSSVSAQELPQLHQSSERRIVQSVRVSGASMTLDVFNTHLGLRPRERQLQSEALVRWISGTAPAHQVLCGDLNAAPGSAPYARLTARMRDAQTAINGRRARSTWPSIWPVLRLDHVLVGRGLRVAHHHVPMGRWARLASDHLPLVVDLLPDREP
jgi:endonuclease/exonuclease/phosphatase family metal-dependent hydrolase